MALSSFAPAKINLFLHVGAPRPDGLHPLDSLVAFADVGDRVAAADAEALTLSVTGPFAAALAGEADNLVLRAARLLAAHAGVAPRAALMLDKHLPIASGIGGGSADAAAALRVLNGLWACRASDDDLEALAAQLGADAPSCVRSRAARMRGVGADLEPASIPSVPALLVNPLVPAATGAVYRAFDALGGDGALTDPGPVGDDLVAWLARTRNDLTAAALSVAPAIAGVMAALRDAAPGGLVRLSGSGATCFALFPDARWRGAVGCPEWWVRATTLGPVDVRVRDDYRPGGDAGARA